MSGMHALIRRFAGGPWSYVYSSRDRSRVAAMQAMCVTTAPAATEYRIVEAVGYKKLHAVIAALNTQRAA